MSTRRDSRTDDAHCRAEHLLDRRALMQRGVALGLSLPVIGALGSLASAPVAAAQDGTFDVAYSLSSIEHFGGWQGARHAVEEMARVVKPGGLVVVATEWVVSGPSRDEVFLPEEFRRLIDVRGLSLVEPLDDLVWRRNTGPVIDVRRNPFETPHMLVRIEETTFTSVLVFLRKDVDHDPT